MEHTWEVWKKDVKDGHIERIHWTLESTDGKNRTASSGSLKLGRSGGIPVELITKELFIKWVKDILGPERIAHFEKHNEKTLEKKN